MWSTFTARKMGYSAHFQVVKRCKVERRLDTVQQETLSSVSTDCMELCVTPGILFIY